MTDNDSLQKVYLEITTDCNMSCDLRETNEDDCFGSGFPSCGDCLWAAGFIQCP